MQAVYRELRKGREAAKDEPGAADFYYGEMEMRRKAVRGGERWLLTGYWAVSGYGLRVSRAVAAFLIVFAVFAGLLYGWGFQSTSPSRITGVNVNSGAVTYAAAPPPQPDLGTAFVYSAESATVFFLGSSPEQLTKWGRAFQVCLRLLGPTLLGLAVLAIRSRVKRLPYKASCRPFIHGAEASAVSAAREARALAARPDLAALLADADEVA